MKYQLSVPTTLNDVTLGQYQQYLELPEGLNENEIALKMITIFCNVPEKVARFIKASDIQDIVEKLSGMFNSNPPLIRRFKIGKTEYGFIPNLENISFGEYIDLDTYLGDWDNMERAMSVLFRPIKGTYNKQYNIEPYEVKDALEYKNMPLDVVLGSIVFFYSLGNELCKVMIHSLQGEEMTYQQQQVLAQSGVGINQFTDYLTEILQGLKISLN